MMLTPQAGTATTPITATRDTARLSDSVRTLVRRLALAALTAAAPALAFGQTAPPSGAPATPPVQAVPGVGGAGAALPGAGLPGPNSELAPAPADLTRYGVAAGVGETDNVNLSSTDPKSQTIAAADLDFDLKRTGSRLDASALGDFIDLDYLQGAYSNQLLGRFDGLATAKLWSDRLKWVVADDFGDEQTNPLAAITPANLQRVNIFSTGPDLTLRPSYSSFINLDGRYSNITYQTSPFDGHDLLGSVEVGRQLSPLARMSVVVAAEQLRFDNTTVNTNYDRREAYGRYFIQGARTSIDAQLGATQANEVASTWKTSPLVRLLLSRRISPFSVLSLDGGREYTDAGDSFSNLTSGAGGGIVVAPVYQTTANAQRTYGSAGWAFTRLRTTLGLTGTWERDAYQGQPIYDATRADVGLNLGRDLTPTLSVNLGGTVDRYDYLNQGFTDNFGTVGGGVTYRAGRSVVIYARYDHSFRSTRITGSPITGSPIGGAGYDENRAFIMIGYRPHSDTEPGESGFGAY
jgi:hypothetical protein